MLKDAPLGIRMMGKLMTPVVGNLVSGMAAAMEEQQQQMSDIIVDAKSYIVQDPEAAELLGEPVEIGNPFSQSSSTMTINDKTQSSLQASMEVRGNRGAGVATISAIDGRIDNLFLNINGRNIAVDITKRAAFNQGDYEYASKQSGKHSGGQGRNRNKNMDNVIDAEFVDKKGSE